MGKKGKVGKNRKDRFYQLAKEQGFRSRASFKLVQLNKRFDFLSGASRGVLDLCAAPGGWLQVARKYIPLNAPCIGIDLVPIRGIPNVVTLTEDITRDSCRSAIKRSLKEDPSASPDDKFDVVLNDGSPNMGSSWLQDAYTQADLTLSALRLATEFLAKDGAFVSKVFRSNDYNKLLYVMNQLFHKVSATKPTASRAESAEIYMICSGYKAPRRIDPQLLDPKVVFRTMEEAETDEQQQQRPKLPDNTVNRKRNREGYSDGVTTLFRKCSVFDFIFADEPIALLGDFNEFEFDPNDEQTEILLQMPETNDEVQAACSDLKVLGRADFKALLRWRSRARNFLKNRTDRAKGNNCRGDGGAGGDPNRAKPDADGPEEEEAEQARLQAEIEQGRQKLLAKEKRQKKYKAKLRSKAQQRIDLQMDLPNDGSELLRENEVFVKFSEATGRIDTDAEAPAVEDAIDDEDMEAVQEPPEEEDEGGEEDYNRELEQQLDFLYGQYEERRKKRSKSKAHKNAEDTGDNALERNGFEEVKLDSSARRGRNDDDDDDDDDSSSSEDEDVAEPADLQAKMAAAHVPSKDADVWFSQPLFQNILEPFSGEEDEEEKRGSTKKEPGERGDTAKKGRTADAKTARQKALAGAEKTVSAANTDEEGEDDGVDGHADVEDNFHWDGHDERAKAEVLASAAKYKLMKKRDRLALVDDSYHRYAFSDPDNVPRWFSEDDERHRQRMIPATKEDVEEMRARMRLLEGRPTKKELEAKGRKAIRAERRITKLRQKMTAIADEDSANAASKLKAIESLIKKSSKKKTDAGKQYVVAAKGGRKVVGGDTKKGARVKYVDRRMKKDKRGIAKANKGKSKGRKAK